MWPVFDSCDVMVKNVCVCEVSVIFFEMITASESRDSLLCSAVQVMFFLNCVCVRRSSFWHLSCY